MIFENVFSFRTPSMTRVINIDTLSGTSCSIEGSNRGRTTFLARFRSGVLLRGDDWGTIGSLGIIIRVLGTELLAILDPGRSVYPLARFLGTGRLRRAD
jgi:hypothetical protein